MIVAAFVVVGLLVAGLVVHRWAKRRLVAGLVATRPAYMVAPPTKRVGPRKRETL